MHYRGKENGTLEEFQCNNRHKKDIQDDNKTSRSKMISFNVTRICCVLLLLLGITAASFDAKNVLGNKLHAPLNFVANNAGASMSSQSFTATTTQSRPKSTIRIRKRRLPEDYFSDMDVTSLEEGLVIGAVLILLLIVLCLLCCCCSMCCGRGGGGGGGCSLMDILALFCCYELFCDDQPGCYIPMAEGDMC